MPKAMVATMIDRRLPCAGSASWLASRGLVDAGVIGAARGVALRVQPGGGFLDRRVTGNRRCRSRPVRREETPQALVRAWIVLFRDGVADVRAGRSWRRRRCAASSFELRGISVARAAGRQSRSARCAARAGKAFGKNAELAVLWPEVMPPLRDAVRLVDGEQRDAGTVEQGKQMRSCTKPLGRDIEKVERARENARSQARLRRATGREEFSAAARTPAA
jgi:hypothetical protein